MDIKSILNWKPRQTNKNLNWNQAKRKYPKLNPFGDADGDKTLNFADCKPFNKKRHGKRIYVHTGDPIESERFEENAAPTGWMRPEHIIKRFKEDKEYKSKFTKEEVEKIKKWKKEQQEAEK